MCKLYTVCPGSLYYTVRYHIKWGKTSWTYSMQQFRRPQGSSFIRDQPKPPGAFLGSPQFRTRAHLVSEKFLGPPQGVPESYRGPISAIVSLRPSFDVTKCLQQIETPDVFHMCAPCFEL